MSMMIYAEIFDIYRKIEDVWSPILAKEGAISTREMERINKLKELESLLAKIIRSPEEYGL